MTNPEPISIGQYRGFDMELSFDTFSREYKITLIHQLRHTVTLGTDIFGNIQRLDNTLAAFEERMAACAGKLENTSIQLENAKAEVPEALSPGGRTCGENGPSERAERPAQSGQEGE